MLTGDISAATLRNIAQQHHIHLYKPVDARSLAMRHVAGILDKTDQKAAAPTVFIVDDDPEIRAAMRDMGAKGRGIAPKLSPTARPS